MKNDQINLITPGSRFEGLVEFSDYTRFEGFIKGTLRGNKGSELILGENGVVEGLIEAETVTIDGFVRGNITATHKVVISETGRVIGEIKSPSVAIKFGGYFDGTCAMDSAAVIESDKNQPSSS